MSKGFDCSTPLTAKTAAAFAADGKQFVGRYLVPSGGKALTLQEANIIKDAGLDIVSVFETTANRALGGRFAGQIDGKVSLEVAEKVGQPEGSTIYFAVDFDVPSSQMPVIIEYIRAASEATPGYNTGVYGSYEVIQAVRNAGACTRFWQTYAWSRGKKAEGIHIYQFKNDITENGIGVDLNEGFEGLGSWNKFKTEEVTPDMSKEDANKLITILKAAYVIVPDPEFGRLADVLRTASNQPTENS